MLEIKDLLAKIVASLPSPNSRLAYIRDIKQFQKWCLDQKIKKPLDLTKEEVDSFHKYLNKHFKHSTIARKITSVRALFKEAYLNALISKNHFDEIVIKNTKKAKTKIRPMDASEVERILLFPKLLTEEGLRDYTMLYLLFSLGLKIGEVTSVHHKDFRTYQDGVLIHIRKPNGKGYYSKVSSNAQKVINTFIKKYRINGFLFTSLAKNRTRDLEGKEPLTARSGWAIVKKYLKLARLDKDRTTNCAREFFVEYLLDEEVSPDTLLRVMGLGSLNALRRYGITDLEKAKSLLTFKDHPVDKIKLNIREY